MLTLGLLGELAVVLPQKSNTVLNGLVSSRGMFGGARVKLLRELFGVRIRFWEVFDAPGVVAFVELDLRPRQTFSLCLFGFAELPFFPSTYPQTS